VKALAENFAKITFFSSALMGRGVAVDVAIAVSKK
jgi:hypothetical protein